MFSKVPLKKQVWSTQGTYLYDRFLFHITVLFGCRATPTGATANFDKEKHSARSVSSRTAGSVHRNIMMTFPSQPSRTELPFQFSGRCVLACLFFATSPRAMRRKGLTTPAPSSHSLNPVTLFISYVEQYALLMPSLSCSCLDFRRLSLA